MPLKSITRLARGRQPGNARCGAAPRDAGRARSSGADRARYLAAFAYLLGRVAHADQHVSPEDTAAMEALVREQGQLPHDQAMVVVHLAKATNLLFGGTANFLVAREFASLATYEQKLALLRSSLSR